MKSRFARSTHPPQLENMLVHQDAMRNVIVLNGTLEGMYAILTRNKDRLSTPNAEPNSVHREAIESTSYKTS